MQLIEKSEISKIETRRKQLESNFSVFSHYEYKQAFSESYSDRIYFAIVGGSDNDIEFIIPLQFNGDTIEFWGTPRADYNEILSDKRIYINFGDIESLLVNKFGKLNIAFKDMPQQYFLNADYVSNDIYKLLIQGSYDESVPSNNVRKQIRKKIYRCDRDGINLSYKLIEGKQAIYEMLPTLFDLHHRKWDKTETPSQFRDRRNVELYYKLAECESLGPQINVLFGNDDVMGIHFGFSKDGIFYLYKSTYNEDYGKYSPGLLLEHFIVENVNDPGIAVFDFLRGEEEYKKRQSNIISQNHNLVVNSNNA